MLNSFIIVLREGFESFLLVAVILTYLRKAGQKWLTPAVYVAIVLALSVSAGLGYLLKNGVDDAVLVGLFGQTLGGYASQFFANEALREAVLGVVAILMVGTLVVHMWRTGPKLQEQMRNRLGEMSSRTSRLAAVAGVFLFTFLMITREGMETALLLLQVRESQMVSGALLGLLAATRICLGLGSLWSPDQCEEVLPSYQRFSSVVHAASCHIFLSRILGGGSVAKQRNASRGDRKVFPGWSLREMVFTSDGLNLWPVARWILACRAFENISAGEYEAETGLEIKLMTKNQDAIAHA